MIQAEMFKATQEKILKSNDDAFPTTPESLSSPPKASDQGISLPFEVLTIKGGEFVKKIVELGKDVATSDFARELIAADLTKKAATGAVVGVGIAFVIPYSLVGLGTGAAVGASLASWNYFSK